ncbi:hypothetical protein EVAR_6258_1 [Eumeta japonica]|uniref:Uncharacterized protein n=1 Tax=Eumeta variegata TaxID=151549 RepID=A0A4C1T872_EUMVA|nr:hypothetical protein EVAR_6258_1 [Eumeta japonica]
MLITELNQLSHYTLHNVYIAQSKNEYISRDEQTCPWRVCRTYRALITGRTQQVLENACACAFKQLSVFLRDVAAAAALTLTARPLRNGQISTAKGVNANC